MLNKWPKMPAWSAGTEQASNGRRELMKESNMLKKLVTITLCLLVLAGSHMLFANNNNVQPPGQLTAKSHHHQALGLASRFLTHYHYKKIELDDQLSAEILKQFIESLDPNRSYFLASDIKEFEAQKDRLDDAIRENELDIPFAVFNRFLQRAEQRMASAQKLVGEPFDFTRQESYTFDRQEADWASSIGELDEIWRQRIKNDELQLRLAGKKETEIKDLLKKRYDNLRKRLMEADDTRAFQAFMNAFGAAIEPHTGYMSPRTSENFNISMRLSLEGIGAVLQSDLDYTVIRRIVPGGPASEDGTLKEGDKIIAVAQENGEAVDVIGWRLDDVVDLIRGPKGSRVSLTYLDGDKGMEATPATVVLTREQVKLEEQAASSETMDIELNGQTKRIGIIDVPTFYIDFAARARGDVDYRSTTRDVTRLIRNLQDQNIDGLIVDLRNNGGGSLLEATELTGLFIDEGPIVQVKNSRGQLDVKEDPHPGIVYDGPLAVLVNRNSASASEIFAAAIQDYHRGLVLGEQTFGKGTVQDLINLDRYTRGDKALLGQLKLTMAQFFRIKGGSTQHRGVLPDISYLKRDDNKRGESAYDNALPWAEIAPAEFEDYGLDQETIAILRTNHQERIKSDEDFQEWLSAMEKYRSRREEQKVSLVLAERQKEKESTPGDASNDEEDESDDEKADALLQESANIMVDMILMGKKHLLAAHATKAA